MMEKSRILYQLTARLVVPTGPLKPVYTDICNNLKSTLEVIINLLCKYENKTKNIDDSICAQFIALQACSFPNHKYFPDVNNGKLNNFLHHIDPNMSLETRDIIIKHKIIFEIYSKTLEPKLLFSDIYFLTKQAIFLKSALHELTNNYFDTFDAALEEIIFKYLRKKVSQKAIASDLTNINFIRRELKSYKGLGVSILKQTTEGEFLAYKLHKKEEIKTIKTLKNLVSKKNQRFKSLNNQVLAQNSSKIF